MARSKSTPEESGGKGRLPAPRKLPSQSRSRSLVSALIEACLRILQGEGAEALTMNRLSEVSGVAVGSIYQYFPNMEAIVTLAFDHILDEEATVHVSALRERIAGLALDAALREILDNMVRMELRLYRLHREFHLKYHPDLKVGMRTGPYENTRQYVDEAWSAFVTMYLPSLDPLRRDMAAYMLGIGMRATIRATFEDAPERVAEPAFRDCLLAMALGALEHRSSS